MKFKEAFEALKQGAMIKLPGWAGYWKWKDNSIKMHCKDGRILDIRESEDISYTLGNILRDDWEIVGEADVKDLNIQTFMFGEALRHLKAGKKVARKGWNGKGIFIQLWKPECDLERVAEAVHDAWWDEKKKQGVTNHPDMIPYMELAEDVKEYDRVTARTTIEAMCYMTHPYIFIDTNGLQTDNPNAPKNRVPWFASQTDMLTDDWVLVE